MTEQPACPRKRPCASCPYRENAPSGVWHPDEYAKLPAYDQPTWAQPQDLFMCHQDDDGSLCSGWVAHADATQLLALRLAYYRGAVDESVFDYTTDVPLHPTGVAAAEHGLRDITAPSVEARQTIDKIVRKRRLTRED